MKRGPKPKFTDDALTAAYGVAMTNRELATMLGVHEMTVARHLRRLGLPALRRVLPPLQGSNRPWRHSHPHDVFRESQLRAAFANGYRTVASVGLELGLTRERVRQLCIRYGIERPPKPAPVLPGCTRCGAVLTKRNRSGLCKMHQKVKRLTYCGWCHAPILLDKARYNRGMKPKVNRKGPRVWPFFCNHKHQGHWVADHVGMGHGKDGLRKRLAGITRNCETCGVPFSPMGLSQRFCPIHRAARPMHEWHPALRARALARSAAWYRSRHPNAKPYQPRPAQP